MKRLLQQGPVPATIDLFPGLQVNETDRRVLEVFDANKNKLVRNVVKLLAPAGMGSALAALLPEELQEKQVNRATQTTGKPLSKP